MNTTNATGVPVVRCPSAVATVAVLARREFRDALGARWFALYTVSFAVLAVSVSVVSLAGSGSQGFAGFGQTTAGLLNLIALVVPLMGITAGAGSVAGERERGSLLYLLAQPVSRLEVILGKFAGLSAAICTSLCFGFGVSGVVLAWRSGATGAGAFLLMVALTCLLGVAMVSLGLFVSVISRKSGVSVGVGLFIWLALVILSDLGLMAGTVMFRLRVQELFALAVVNPLQAFKMGVIVNMNASLDVLGPAGVYASHAFGSALPWLLVGVIVAWIALPLIGTIAIFQRRSPT